MTEQEIVRECLTEIFRKNGYHQIHNLTQRDFDHISQEIDQLTGILVSGSTIKRLLSGQFSRLPQIATLDAISRYMGFKNWQEYKAARIHSDAPQRTETAPLNPETKRAKKPIPLKRTLTLTIIGCLVLAAIAVVAFVQLSKQAENLDKASFSVRKTTDNDIPNTVVFNYNVDKVAADSFFIQQSWDTQRRVRIAKNNYTLTDIYYEPGYHIAKLIANDSVIRVIDVSIPTDRWFYFAKDNPHSKPEYITATKNKSGRKFGIVTQDLIDNKIDITKEKEYSYTFFPGKIDVNSDHFSLKTRIKINQVRNNFCPYVSLEIFTQRYPLFLKITPKGCASESSLQLGEKVISGKSSDLSFLGFDVKQWMDLELLVKNKQVKILLNRKEVYSGSYETSSRLITGLGFMSNGLCEVDFVELKGLDGTIVYDSRILDNSRNLQ